MAVMVFFMLAIGRSTLVREHQRRSEIFEDSSSLAHHRDRHPLCWSNGERDKCRRTLEKYGSGSVFLISVAICSDRRSVVALDSGWVPDLVESEHRRGHGQWL
ncbi:hypothetical protein L484_023943 [Morus notabilis]|uniref:Secreted protein n=1 Tax=Morus notabilis TaxID=981085 RepID=W9RB15_9ROSA|nr:hypothetical protein L484_023943 [Morus notabilis]